jgi:hypothetical protein
VIDVREIEIARLRIFVERKRLTLKRFLETPMVYDFRKARATLDRHRARLDRIGEHFESLDVYGADVEEEAVQAVKEHKAALDLSVRGTYRELSEVTRDLLGMTNAIPTSGAGQKKEPPASDITKVAVEVAPPVVDQRRAQVQAAVDRAVAAQEAKQASSDGELWMPNPHVPGGLEPPPVEQPSEGTDTDAEEAPAAPPAPSPSTETVEHAT